MSKNKKRKETKYAINIKNEKIIVEKQEKYKKIPNKTTKKTKEKIYSIATIILIIDQIVKLLITNKLVLNEELTIIPNFFSLYYVENTGAAFSILENQIFLLVIISFFFLFFIDKMLSTEEISTELTKLSFGMIIGGVLGNLIDILLHHCVIDYLSFTFFKYKFAVFNIADIAIVLGIVLLTIDIYLEEKKNVRK